MGQTDEVLEATSSLSAPGHCLPSTVRILKQYVEDHLAQDLLCALAQRQDTVYEQ